MSHWDGNDYQFYARFTIVVSLAILIFDRLWSVADGTLFVMAIAFLLIVLGIIPEGPRPPVD